MKEMGLPTLEDRRGRNQTDEREDRHSRKIRKSRCLKDIKKYSFPHRIIIIVDTWNGLKEEVVTATKIHK